MPEPITQPATRAPRESTPGAVPAGSKQSPVFVEITRIRIPFDDVFDLVFKVIVSQVIIAAIVGIVVGAIWLFLVNS